MVAELPPPREGQAPLLLVGSERIRTLWTDVARRAGMVFDGESLSTTVGDVRLEVREDTVLGDVPHLVAKLSWQRSLGPEVGLSKNVTGFRRRRRRGRFSEQSDHLFARLSGLVAELDSYDVGDREATLMVPARGVRLGPLLRFCRIAQDVAAEIGALHRSMPLPPPVQENAAAWRALARRLDGTLWPGPAAITGSQSGVAIEIAADWDSDAGGIQVAARPPWLLQELPELRGLADETGLEDAVSQGEQELRVVLPEWPADADRVLSVVRKLVALAQRMRAGGPFR
jgi:hypothetical protein